MNRLPTLWPWLKSHVFMLLTIASALAVALGVYSRDVFDAWWQVGGWGLMGMVAFGILTIIEERKSKPNRVVAVVGITVGLGLSIAIVAFTLMLMIMLFAIAGSASHS